MAGDLVGSNQQVVLSDQDDNEVIVTRNRLTTESEIKGKSGSIQEVDPFGQARVQTPPISLFSDNFLGNLFDVSINGKWIETIGGSGGARVVTERTLTLSLTTAIGSVEEVARVTGLSGDVGNFTVMTHAMNFGINRPVGHYKQWGYRNAAKTDGVYFKIEGDVFEWYTLKSGVETLQLDISSALTDPDIAGGLLGSGNGGNPVFTLFQLFHLESGKITVKVGGKQLDTTIAGGAGLTGDAEKIPFMEVGNTAITATVPDDYEMHWIDLADESGTKMGLAGYTLSGVLKNVLVNDLGQLVTVASTGAAPPSTTPVIVAKESSVSGTADDFYVIPNGQQFTLLQFSSNGDPTSNSGHKVSLYKSPNGVVGDAIESNLVAPSGFSANASGFLEDNFLGDGTFAILLRREVLGGGSKQVGGFYRGYLQTL